MKIKLLLPVLFASAAGFAQQSVNSFYNVQPFINGAGYSLVTSETDLNESSFGENLNWNFNNLTVVGDSNTNTLSPSADELSSYPNTNAVVHTFFNYGGDQSENTIFLSWTGDVVSLTGISIPGVTLNYTDNGAIGTFPLNYGYSNSDNVSGTFYAQGLPGTFTGTIQTSVDAYGVLNSNIGGFSPNAPVTRLKIAQQLTLYYLGIPAGTIDQTTYGYYDAANSDPVFRSTTTHVSAPLLNVNDTTTTLETYIATLGSKNFESRNKTVIAPNPVADVLHFAGDKTITGVTITDASGRIVLQSKADNNIAVNNLSAGVYYVALQSGTGTEVQKMVKR